VSSEKSGGTIAVNENSECKHHLAAGPQTVHVGHFSSDLSPVLRINSGDTVSIETFSTVPAEEYEAGGIEPNIIPQALREIFSEVKDRGPGPHLLTGPIYVNGAEPGDTLEVHIKKVELTQPFGHNSIICGMGALPEEFPYTARKIVKIDLQSMTSEIGHGIILPLRPFFGTMGVAPPSAMGRINSMAPGIFGGNMDNKELIPGTVLFLPIHVKGALFSIGDAHAVQGDGEVNVSALETAAKGALQFQVRKDQRIKWPRAETPDHFILMGFNQDLDIAAQMAVREVIEFLGEEKGIRPEDAYRIASLSVDLHVTQIVDGVKGIHAMIPKSIFDNPKSNDETVDDSGPINLSD
jgi:acetamidase/formamidase